MRFSSVCTIAAVTLSLAACSGSKTENADVADNTETMTSTTAPDAEAPAADAESSEATAPEKEAEAPKAEEVAEAPKAEEAKPAPAPTAAAVPATPKVEKVAAAAPAAAAPAGPPASFARCAVCHTANKGGEDKLGPNLFGVFGHKAGQGSFAFSDALKNSGLVLDEPTLHKWLENPRALVPGNRMSFPGLKDPAKRQEIIDYLKQQS